MILPPFLVRSHDPLRLSLSVCLTIGWFCLTPQILPAATVQPPNVVFIISDDQTYRDFGFMGNADVQTPHLDALAAQSAHYPNGYVPSSVCRPSLATLLTGLYPHQHQIHFNHPPPGNAAFNRMTSAQEYVRVRSAADKLILGLPTLPRALARAGYRCLQTGKHWEGHFSNAGFTEGMTLFEASADPAHGNRQLAGGQWVAHGNGDAGLNIGRQSMKPIDDFLDSCGSQQPFLIWYAPFLPHQPHDSPQKYYDRYKNVSGLPANHLPYYASISEFDETVGHLTDQIQQRGLASRTLIVMLSDNGWTASERREKNRPEEFAHTRQSKRSPFEDGLRTPILIRWDEHVQPATHAALVSSVDVVPTVLSALGLSGRMGDLPGRDLMPSALGHDTLSSRPVFGEIYPGDASSLGNPAGDVAYRWVRFGQYKLIVPQLHGADKAWEAFVPEVSLFKLEDDPNETTNLADDPIHADHLHRLHELLDAWWTPESAG